MLQTATWDDPVALEPIPHDEDGADNDVATTADNRLSTGRTPLIYPYVLTITPKYENKNDIVVKVKAFEDMVLPTPFKYTPPTREVVYVEGRSKLTVKVGKEVLKDTPSGHVVKLTNKRVIPKDGYIVATDPMTGIALPTNADAMITPRKRPNGRLLS